MENKPCIPLDEETFSESDIEKLRQFPFIDQSLLDSFLKHQRESNEHLQKWNLFLLSNPTDEEKQKWLIRNASSNSIEGMGKEVKFLRYISENKERIIQWLENESKSNTFRKAGHLIDQQLKYQKQDRDQLDLFSIINNHELRNSLQQEVLLRESELELGIHLTPSQDRLVNALCRLLQEKNHPFNTDISHQLNSNQTYLAIPYGNITEKIPMLILEPHELYQAYLEKIDFSGKEMANIEQILEQTEKTRHLIVYEWRTKTKSGKILVDRIEQYQPLFAVDKIFPNMTEEEASMVAKGDTETRRRKIKLLIKFNPIFIHQIESKYVLYPKDIHQRMTKAVGGDPRKITPAMITLRDHCLRALSNKQRKIEINQAKLPFLMKLDNYVKAGRRKDVEKKIQESFQVCKEIELIDRWEEEIGANNQIKIGIYLNPNFLGKI
jgi:hypothetical protein